MHTCYLLWKSWICSLLESSLLIVALVCLDFSIGPETERSFKHEETLDPGRLDSNPIIPVFVEILASRGTRGDIHAHRSIDARALSRVEMAKSILESSNEEF